MQILPIDITSVIAVIMGISVVLIPVIGITARFALKPTVEALARVFESRGANESLQIVERRLSLLEAQMEGLEASMKRVEEASDFHAQLKAGSPGEALQQPDGSPKP